MASGCCSQDGGHPGTGTSGDARGLSGSGRIFVSVSFCDSNWLSKSIKTSSAKSRVYFFFWLRHESSSNSIMAISKRPEQGSLGHWFPADVICDPFRRLDSAAGQLGVAMDVTQSPGCPQDQVDIPSALFSSWDLSQWWQGLRKSIWGC